MVRNDLLLFGALWVHPGYYDRFKQVFKSDATLQSWNIALENLNPYHSLLIFSIDPQHRPAFIRYFVSQYRFTRSFQRLTWINPLSCCSSVEEVFETIRTHANYQSPGYRLECYPRRVKDSLLPQLLETPLPLCHIDHTDVISVFLWPRVRFSKTKYPDRVSRDEYYLGFFPREEQVLLDAQALQDSTAVCSARYKIQEAVHHAIPSTAWTDIHYVIDLGAAPGGWTGYLLEQSKRVASVDPALMDEIQPSPEWVHIQKVSSEAREELVQFHDTYDLLVCDMNRAPQEAAGFCLQVSDLIRPGGWLILTLKLSQKPNNRELRNLKRDMATDLQEHWNVLDFVWLFANTLKERTLIAQRK